MADEASFDEHEAKAFMHWEGTLDTVRLNARGVDYVCEQTGWSRSEVLLLGMLVALHKLRNPLSPETVKRLEEHMNRHFDETDEDEDWRAAE